MKISIITIAWNSAETIEATIQSVISQTHEDVEYIIIDGSSADGTMNIVRKHKAGITKVVSEPDKGIYDAMNKGIELASGDIIGILNSDDFYSDETVLSAVNDAFENNNTDALYADLIYVDRDDTDKVIRYWRAGPYKKGAFRKGWMPPHPTFFVKKSCYDLYGTYSLQLKSAADYELMLRMLEKYQINVQYLPKTITKMRVGGQSNVTLKNRWKANREDREAWRMNGLEPSPTTMIRKPLSKISQYFKR